MAHTPSDTIVFYSGAKAPHYVLSNLYRAAGCEEGRDIEVVWPSEAIVPAFLRGMACAYPTREHAYQSLRAADLRTARALMVGGRLAGWDAFERWPAKKGWKDDRARMQAHWGKKGMLGIVAKMAVTARWDGELSFVPRGKWDDEAAPAQIWALLHAAFFVPGAAETAVLKGTCGKRLAEFHRRSTADSFYSCKFVEGGKRVGKNRMGRMLEAFRDLV